MGAVGLGTVEWMVSPVSMSVDLERLEIDEFGWFCEDEDDVRFALDAAGPRCPSSAVNAPRRGGSRLRRTRRAARSQLRSAHAFPVRATSSPTARKRGRAKCPRRISEVAVAPRCARVRAARTPGATCWPFLLTGTGQSPPVLALGRVGHRRADRGHPRGLVGNLVDRRNRGLLPSRVPSSDRAAGAIGPAGIARGVIPVASTCQR